MSNELGRTVFVLAVLIFLGWFAVGTHVNVRKGHRLLRWLQDGMPLLGAKTTVRWLGSSAIELKVPHALEPLRSVDVFIVLEPRDIPFLWWLFHARGRRDLLIVRAQVTTTPAFELEALDRRAWSTRAARAMLHRSSSPSRPSPRCRWCASPFTAARPTWKCNGRWPGWTGSNRRASWKRSTGWPKR